MTASSMTRIHAGFIPLLDAALLVVARAKGFAEDEGIDITLVRETSWANIRDRMAVGHFQIAHMLAPMPVAAALGLSPLPIDILAPMALGLGGNAVTVSPGLAAALSAAGYDGSLDAAVAGAALRQVIGERGRSGAPRLTFAVVHPYSGHNYELRYWLAASGVRPDEDVDIVIVPPPLMPDAIAAGRIDGYCVGEPWNSIAAHAGTGVILTTKSSIWRSSPEKVLGVTRSFAEEEPESLSAILRALYRSASWCGDPDNLEELAILMAAPDVIGCDTADLLPALRGRMETGTGESRPVPDFFQPVRGAATFPWKSHALWFFTQMVRWGHVDWSPENAEKAAASFRPDLYRSALAPAGVSVPTANSKVEGALVAPMPAGSSGGDLILGPDGFFDRSVFDPDAIEAYVRSQNGSGTSD